MRRSFLIAIGVAVVMGCNNKGSGLKTYPVTGTVTYNGKPVEGANVAYVTDKVDAPRSAGITDSDGRFSLTTYAGPQQLLRGAVPGDYKVTISKVKVDQQQAAANSQMTNWANLSDKERAELTRNMTQQMGPQSTGNQKPAEKKPVSEIPEKYSRPETSGLAAQVVVGENEPREFKLNDD